MKRSMGSVVSSIFHRNQNRFPGNGSGQQPAEPSSVPRELQALPHAVHVTKSVAEENGSSASPRTAEFDFMAMLRDPEQDARAERSAARQ